MIGFSVTSIARDTAILLTKAVKSKYPDVFIVWGGIDVTTSPDVAVKYPDAVCIGEGYTILDLLHNLETGKSVNKIKNLWIKKGNEIIRNNLRPLVQDLNSLPAPDFSFENKFSINEDELITNDTSINNEPGIYTIMTSMGCPFSCSYCCNNYLRNLYKGQKYLRRKSVELVIEELKEAKKNYVIRYVDFYDEVFTFDKEWIKKFARLYKKEIKIPFWCNVSPFFVDEEVLMMLKDCGLDSVTMGIQSGSEKILFEKYNRKTPVSEIKKCAMILYKLKIPVFFDIITNSPFETEEDCRKTFELLLELPQRKKFMLGLAKLSLFPNTSVDKLAKNQKVEQNPKMFEFWNRMYLLTQSYLSKRILSAISKNEYFKENPRKLNTFFIFSPTAIWTKAILTAREILPTNVFNYIKSIKYNLLGK